MATRAAHVLALLTVVAMAGCASGERDGAGCDAHPTFGFKASSDEGAQAGVGFHFGDAPKQPDQPR